MKSKGSSARDRGKRGERMWRDELRAYGWEATRTGWHQAAIGHESKDVSCPAMPIHWEVKFTEQMSLAKWKEQIADDCRDGEIPIIAWKKAYQPWLPGSRKPGMPPLRLKIRREILSTGPRPSLRWGVSSPIARKPT